MSGCSVLLGGRADMALAEKISEGRHPRVEYLEFVRRHSAALIDFGDVAADTSALIRLAARRLGPYWGMAALAAKRSRRLGSILTMGEDIGWPFALLKSRSREGLPSYIITHGSYLGSSKAAWVLEALRRRPDVHSLCLSESLRRRLVERHNIPEERAVNAGYGVDLKFFSPPATMPPAGNILVSAGMANRDYCTLIAATAGLDVQVKIAADSAWFRSDLDIARTELPLNVEARSYGNYTNLRSLYAQADFVVVPLYPAVHACGYAVIAEAMAMGKTVIATKTASSSDYVIEGKTGFHVPVGDVGALRERIQHLRERPDVATRMGRDARLHMEENFSLEAYVNRIAAAMGLSLDGRND